MEKIVCEKIFEFLAKKESEERVLSEVVQTMNYMWTESQCVDLVKSIDKNR